VITIILTIPDEVIDELLPDYMKINPSLLSSSWPESGVWFFRALMS
jgi:hypothetical protein